MKKLIVVFVAFVLLGFASTAFAQAPVKNPTTAVLTVSPDHADITRYELGFFLVGAAEPVQVADIGTGTPVNGELSKPLPSYPIGVTYVAKARAYAGTMASSWSPASNSFFREPAPPVGVAIR
jgi:hypothetical protein